MSDHNIYYQDSSKNEQYLTTLNICPLYFIITRILNYNVHFSFRGTHVPGTKYELNTNSH